MSDGIGLWDNDLSNLKARQHLGKYQIVKLISNIFWILDSPSSNRYKHILYLAKLIASIASYSITHKNINWSSIFNIKKTVRSFLSYFEKQKIEAFNHPIHTLVIRIFWLH